MNVKFKLKDVNIKIPEQDIKINIGELHYEIENANVLELAKATKQIFKAFVECDMIANGYAEAPKMPDVPWDTEPNRSENEESEDNPFAPRPE